jgi:endonuclease YncB( thermonuclease family)
VVYGGCFAATLGHRAKAREGISARQMKRIGRRAILVMLPIAALAAALIFTSMPDSFATDLVGQASIIDGDTLEIHGMRIRLWGIDAPESDQLCQDRGSERYRCGQKAANDLDAVIARRPVNCVEVDQDRYKPAVAVCAVAGIDLADWMVRSGLALDWPKYSQGNYAAAQDEARRAQWGMWGGRFVVPWRYRACRRTGGSPVSCSDGQ